MQRPKLCSEQSLFKQSLTGNLAPLTHSDSTLLRKKERGAEEPALGRVSRQELALRPRAAEHASLCLHLPAAPKPQRPSAWLSKRGPAFSTLSHWPSPTSWPSSVLPPILPPPSPSPTGGTLRPVSTSPPPLPSCCPSGWREGPTGPQGFQAAGPALQGAGRRQGRLNPPGPGPLREPGSASSLGGGGGQTSHSLQQSCLESET